MPEPPFRLDSVNLPDSSADDIVSKPSGTPRTLVKICYALCVTLLSAVIGGAITVIGTIIVLEALHTKNAIVDLLVVSMTIATGGVAAIALRRKMLGAIKNEKVPNDTLS